MFCQEGRCCAGSLNRVFGGFELDIKADGDKGFGNDLCLKGHMQCT
jgi:hypothetical protein